MPDLPQKSSGLAARWLMPVALFVGGAAFFIAVALDIAHDGKLAQADRMIAPYFYFHANRWLIILASAASGLGDLHIIVPYAAVVTFVLARKRRWGLIVFWLLALLGSGFICGTLKNAWHIPRPMHTNYVNFGPDVGYSFPSGHTMGATVTAGATVLLLMRLKPRRPRTRWAMGAAAGATGVIAAGGLLYIGVHYLTDVLAGLGAATAWLGVLRGLLPPARETRPAGVSSPSQEIPASGG